ncbi:hypothetical protein Sjap_016037 [Stephania japonica]|uniref:Uncharacterized protein n=1 Tax=Stephania japonica TaxID=461633 RepID=A0AAP0IL39_9MAGN
MLTDKENLIGNPEDNHESKELGDPRYWVRKRSTGIGFLDTIASESEKPEEDQSKPSYTLFEPVYAGNEGHVCELHCLSSENGALFLTLDRGQLSLSKSPTLLFEIVEWDKMITDRTIGNEVFVNEDGTIRIKSIHLDLDITKEAHLVVEELVSSRTIYNVEYHVEAANVDIDRKVIMAI